VERNRCLSQTGQKVCETPSQPIIGHDDTYLASQLCEEVQTETTFNLGLEDYVGIS
jgi:hypothetical protein